MRFTFTEISLFLQLSYRLCKIALHSHPIECMRSFERCFLFSITICLSIFPEAVRAQNADLSGGSVVIKRLSVDQGLSQRNIRCITQDSRGFIWVGTAAGVNRYNGEKFSQFLIGTDSTSLVAMDVWGGICADLDGVVWVGTSRGLYKFNPSTGSFKRYGHDARNPATLHTDSINCIYIDRAQTLWVGTPSGLSKLNRATEVWTRYYTNPGDHSKPGQNYVNVILEDRKGTFWIGTGGRDDQLNGGGLFTLDRSSGRFISVGPRVGINSLYEDRSGELWVSLVGPRLCSVDRSTGTFTSIPLPTSERGNPKMQGIRSICEDGSGSLWMATLGWTLLRYEKPTKSFTRFSYDPKNSESISSSSLITVFADRDGLVWVGTERSGVNTVSTKPFAHLHSLGNLSHLSARVDVVFQDREGFLWIGSVGNGVWRYNPVTGKSTCILPKGLIRNIIQDSKGFIWIADRYSVLRFDPKLKTLQTAWNVPTLRGVRDRLVTMMWDREQNLWLGGNSAVYRVTRGMKKLVTFVHDRRDDRSITAGQAATIIQDQKDRIWIGTAEGLNRFDKESGSFTRFPFDKKDSSSLNVNNWPRVHIDKNGTVWVGTQLGLCKFDEATSTFSLFIPGNGNPRAVTHIQEDAKGRLWCVSAGRIMKFDPSNCSFTSFDRADGVEDVEILAWSHTRLESGEILFGTIDGILVFHPDSLKKATSIPPIVITGIKKLNESVHLKSTPELLREISFNHDENVFSISYSALSYDMPEYNQYAYKLEGFDKDWIFCGNRKEVTYTNLDPGRYIFRVKGANHDEVWNETGASLTAIVNPAWWQTVWFTALVWVSVISAIGGTVRFVVVRRLQKRITQLEQEKAIERDRARISQDLHDEIGSSLSEIAILSSLGKRKPKEAQLRLEEISERAASVIENLGEIVWAINPRNDTLDNLFSHIRRYTVHYLDLARIQCVCCAPDSIPSVPVTAEVRRNIFLIVKEALHNVVKYAHASRVSFDMMYLNDSITVIIADNGKGFLIHEKMESGNGLGNMKRRMDDIGGTISLDTAPGCGTRITLSVAIQKVPPLKIPNSTD
jgi:ligand-binding sensor domain-containing protein/signal transduction histidine kinase